MIRFLSFLVVVLATTVALAASPVRVEFDTDKSEIRQNEAAKLDAIADMLKAHSLKIVLIGHADDRASRGYNLDLAMRRAEAVEKALTDLGVPIELIEATASSGEERPIAPNDKTDVHRQVNRNVEVILSEREVAVAVAVPVEVVKEVRAYRKNRVTLLGGFGPFGISKHTLGVNHYKVEQDYSAVFGLGYSRSLSDRWNVGVQGFTNNSYFLNVGFDF